MSSDNPDRSKINLTRVISPDFFGTGKVYGTIDKNGNQNPQLSTTIGFGVYSIIDTLCALHHDSAAVSLKRKNLQLAEKCPRCQGYCKKNGFNDRHTTIYLKCLKCGYRFPRPATIEDLESRKHLVAPCQKCKELISICQLKSHEKACDGLGGDLNAQRSRRKWVKNLSPEQLKKDRQQRKDSYQRNREQIRARQSAKYHSDPEYRAQRKLRAMLSRGRPDRKLVLKKRRSDKYWSNPELHKKRANDWYHANRQKCLKRDTERRVRNREQSRALTRRESALLTDSYVRNQLSKYSTKSTREWTEADVDAKRQTLLMSRAKRITQDKANAIRIAYNAGKNTANQLAELFGVSVSNIFMILSNRTHIDPTYTRQHISAPAHLAKVLKMMVGANELAKAYGNQ